MIMTNKKKKEKKKNYDYIKNDEKVIESIFILPNQTIELPILEKRRLFIYWVVSRY